MKRERQPAAEGPGKTQKHEDRVRYLLEVFWNNNRSAMARDIGVSHSIIAKVVAGDQPPGRHLMAKIAEHPRINPGWVLSGEGEPFVAEHSGAAEGWPVPVSW